MYLGSWNDNMSQLYFNEKTKVFLRWDRCPGSADDAATYESDKILSTKEGLRLMHGYCSHAYMDVIDAMCENGKMIPELEVCDGTDAQREEILDRYPYTAQVFLEGGHLLIAKAYGELLGFSWSFQRQIPVPVERSEDFINVIEVFDPDMHGKGIGSLLIQKEIEYAETKGCYQVRAYCDIQNVSSHMLWVKNGFGISPVKYADGSIPGSFVTFTIERNVF